MAKCVEQKMLDSMSNLKHGTQRVGQYALQGCAGLLQFSRQNFAEGILVCLDEVRFLLRPQRKNRVSLLRASVQEKGHNRQASAVLT